MGYITTELTLSELWRPPAPAGINRREWEENMPGTYSRGDGVDWFGMEREACMALPERGWPEGVDAALRLLDEPELEQGTTRIRRRWSEEDGELLDAQRALDGLPCWRQMYRAPGGSGGRIVTLLIHGGGSWRVTPEEIAWRAYATVRFADAMESAGYRVAMDISFAARGAYTEGEDRHRRVIVHVKGPEDPVDLSQIAAILSAAAFRWHVLSWWASVPQRLDSGWGSMTEMGTDDPTTVQMGGHIRDKASAQEWLESSEERLRL